jgi:GNAT superfamily N-acetyltransferase
MIRVAALDRAGGGAWARLFDACNSSCFCRYWHFEGNKNDWLARCAHDADANRREHLSWIEAADPRARGLVAWQGDLAVGWMKLAPRACLGKLTRLPVYRSIEIGDDAGVYSVGCFLVAPAYRRRGVARALLASADTHVRAWGGVAIDAYPRHTEGPLHDEEAWMGPESLFREAGYETASGSGAYPVYRRQLGSRDAG